MSTTFEQSLASPRTRSKVDQPRIATNTKVFAFAFTVFLSAFLLFQVQPLTSKFILPWFGGSPAVWTAAMLFYQTLLFGGYLYAHCSSTYLRPRAQLAVHLAVLAAGIAAVLWLRITPPQWLRPAGDEQASPLGEILVLLGVTVGVPYFALSSTGPLLQKWFSDTFDGASPYRLFALSNFGSLLALLSYPFVVEVYWGSFTQALAWSGGFLLFTAACAYCAVQTYQARRSVSVAVTAKAAGASAEARPTWADRATWLFLPTLASVMFLAVTNEVCQNVTTVPLLWIVPLSLYLLTFIIAFDGPRWYWRPAYLTAAIVLLWVMADYDSAMEKLDAALNLSLGFRDENEFALADSWGLQSAVYFAGFFAAAMVCHGELARRKPAQRYLTSYYLTMSLGGAVGGILVNLAAPQLFTTFFEYPLALFLSLGTMVLLAAVDGAMFPTRVWRPALVAVGALAFVVVGYSQVYRDGVAVAATSERVPHRARNFFGVVSVQHRDIGEPDEDFTFFSGHVQHGKQFTDPALRHTPLTYYGEGSGIAKAIEHVQTTSDNCRIGVIGLGTGTLATYGRPGDEIRFYEINPEVVKIARNTEWFHYLSDCPSKVDVVLGDARLQLERELKAQGSHGFDVLCIDAFSGDAIPSHLLTNEAFDVYKKHLRPGGILALHITNTHLDLYPVVKRLADHHGLKHTRIYHPGDYDRVLYRNYYVLVTTDEAFLKKTPEQIVDLPEDFARDIDVPLWTDEYHNLWQLLR